MGPEDRRRAELPSQAPALEPFPVPVRTLDALHLASIEFLRRQGQRVELTVYDDRMLRVARKLRVPIYRL